MEEGGEDGRDEREGRVWERDMLRFLDGRTAGVALVGAGCGKEEGGKGGKER